MVASDNLTSADWLKEKVYEGPTPTVEQVTAAKDVLKPLFDSAKQQLATAFAGKIREDLDAAKPDDVALVCKVFGLEAKCVRMLLWRSWQGRYVDVLFRMI